MDSTVIIILSVVLILFITLLLAGNYFYNFSVLRRKKEFLNNDPDLKETTPGANWDSKKEWLQQQKQELLEIQSDDSLKLSAIFLPHPTGSDKTVILVHGYSSWNSSMGGFAHYYMESLGYNVLMPDLRGHGKSEGNYIGFGWHDRKDVQQWIDVILAKLGQDQKIVLHGVSMGGATVLMTSGEMLPSNVKCIVSDCAYNSVTGILGYQMKRMFHLPKFPLIQVTSLITSLRAGYSFSEVSAVKQVQKTTLPILFIHGSADRFVPTEMIHELYAAAKGPKQLLVIEGASHGTSFWKDPIAYKEALINLLSKYVI